MPHNKYKHKPVLKANAATTFCSVATIILFTADLESKLENFNFPK